MLPKFDEKPIELIGPFHIRSYSVKQSLKFLLMLINMIEKTGNGKMQGTMVNNAVDAVDVFR